MAHLNIDEIEGLTEPLSFTLEGKKYKIDSLKPDLLDKAHALTKQVIPDHPDYDPDMTANDLQSEQLAVLTGEPITDFNKLDVRKTAEALGFILNEIEASAVKRKKRQRRKRSRG